jgi:GDP/UDP-N,N'-diacetylbacillosamine 2-epimerase (hydrolysing)
MRVAILTSSRADFGIYLPLLKKMQGDSFFDLEIIAFGTHLSKRHGYTIDEIIKNGFSVEHKIDTLIEGDTPVDINNSIAKTFSKFGVFWDFNKYDLVLCLGDRYEMFAAVLAGISFGVNFAHIHAGEKTMGAIDNVFRHSISHSAELFFTSTLDYSKRVQELVDDINLSNIVCVGALSLDTLFNFEPFTINEMATKFGINFTKTDKTILTTFHPETVNYEANEKYAMELVNLISNDLKNQYIITMPNADASGNAIREIFLTNFKDINNVRLVENLGTKGYFSAMHYCNLLMGNTSSGIIEAASFKKYVINIGDRQKGRLHGDNVIDCEINSISIKELIDDLLLKGDWEGGNIYYSGGAADKIIQKLKSI